MGAETKIQWTDHTFNPWIGCHKVSEACKHCYAEVETFPRVQRGRGLELWGADAGRHVTSEANWRKPLAWDRDAAASGVRRRVFCASMADVFEDRDDLAPLRGRLWELIGRTKHLDWLLLTKRPEHVRASVPWGRQWPFNVWLGTTVENQKRAEERIPHLLATHARVKFLSCEPLLEKLDLTHVGEYRGEPLSALDEIVGLMERPRVDWVIVGGESGPKARPFDLAWARSIVRQCRDVGVPVFVKQLGEVPIPEQADMSGRRIWMWASRENLAQRLALKLDDPKGGDPDEWPSDLRVRQFPEVRS